MTQISQMTSESSLPSSGAIVPVVINGTNYSFDIGAEFASLTPAASRSALASSPTSSGALFLKESGFEGMFVFDTSDLSAEVTADPTQTNYVAPTSDTTGASGAWVRKIDATILLRERLQTDRTYYVSTTGSDSNTGLASGTAFATIQKAIDTVYQKLDLAGHSVTISIADGTYTGSMTVFGRLVSSWDSSSQPLKIIGNETTPANVVIAPSSASYALQVSDFAYLLLAGVTLQNASGSGILAENSGFLEHRNCVLGATSSEKILTLHHAVVRAIGSTIVTGNSTSFCHATKRSIIDFASQTVTFTGSPVFSTYLWGVNDASVDLDSATIVGTATGGIFVHDNGILNVSSLTGNYLGGAAPIANDGGIIAIADKLQNRNFYVNGSTGNDNNDGLDSSRPFKTIQAAVNAASQLPFNPIAWSSTLAGSITINVAGPYTYNETVNLRDLHYLSGTIEGDETTPANVVIQGTSDGFSAIGIRTPWYVRGCRIHAATGYCLTAQQGSMITHRKTEMGTGSQAHLFAYQGGRIIADGDYAIVAASPIHARSWMNGFVDITGRTVTISNTPAFSSEFAEARLNGTVRADATYSGSATGTRYYAETGGVIYTNGGTLPGDVAGSTGAGGQFL